MRVLFRIFIQVIVKEMHVTIFRGSYLVVVESESDGQSKSP